MRRNKIQLMRERFQNMVQQVAEPELLINDGATVSPSDKGCYRSNYWKS